MFRLFALLLHSLGHVLRRDLFMILSSLERCLLIACLFCKYYRFSSKPVDTCCDSVSFGFSHVQTTLLLHSLESLELLLPTKAAFTLRRSVQKRGNVCVFSCSVLAVYTTPFCMECRCGILGEHAVIRLYARTKAK